MAVCSRHLHQSGSHPQCFGSSNAGFVTDEVVDRFCLVGPAEKHVARLNRLREVGVTQFNIYLMCGDEEQTLIDYRRHVLQHFGV